MKIKWLVQDVGKYQMLKDNFETLKNINSKFQGFGLITGIDEMTNLENILLDINEFYIIRGGTKVVSLLEKFNDINLLNKNLNEFQKSNASIFYKKLRSGIFYDLEKFDQFFYSKLNLPLLNKDAFFLPISEHKLTKFKQNYFIKPSKDLKTFLPGIIENGQTIKSFIENSQHLKYYEDEIALIAPLKNIKKEYRFFVINKEVITGSLYKNNDKVEYNSFIHNAVFKLANEYAQLYQPHDIFTMDLAETENDFKIVEYNCWNGSGLYHSNKELLFSSVENYMKNKISN